MKVSYYYNGSRPHTFEFIKYLPSDVEILYNECTADTQIIYCASNDGTATTSPQGCLFRAFQDKRRISPKAILVCYVWDVPDCLPGMKMVVDRNLSLLKICDYVISASNNTQNILKGYHIKSDREYFYAADHDQLVSHPRNLPKEDQVIHVGRYVPHKHFEMIIEAMWNMPTTLVCIGAGQKDPEYFESLQKQANTNVKFLYDIPRAQVLDEIQKSKLLVSCSEFEGLGLPPIEATLLGTPIALRKIPVFREVYGPSVPYFSCASELYDVIDEVLSVPEYTPTMVNMARDCIRSFTPEHFAHRWYNLMVSYIGKKK